MQDSPGADAILAEVADGLNVGLPEGLQQRIAANAILLARRELTHAEDWAAEEQARLEDMLKQGGPLAELNAALAEAIRTRRLGMETPGLLEHLRRVTIDKIRVDQPTYPAYVAWAGQTNKDR